MAVSLIPISVLATIAAIFILLTRWIKRKGSCIARGNSLPGPPNLPFLGCALQVAYLGRKYKSFEVFEQFCKKYGSVVGLQIGLQYTVVVKDFETAKKILSSEDWQARNPEYSSFKELTFDKQVGVMFAYGEGWRENRRFVLRALKEVGFGLRKQLELTLTEELQHFYKSFDAKRLAGQDEVSMHRVFKLASLNILWRTLCGTRCSEEDEFIVYMIGRVEDTAQGMGVGCVPEFAFPFLSKVPWITNQKFRMEGMTILQNYFKGIIDQRRESQSASVRVNPKDFIGCYMKRIDEEVKEGVQDSVYNDEQLIQSCCDMFLAGADTSGDSMEFAILYMVKFLSVQRKVQAEIDCVVPTGQSPRYEDAEQMPYTQAVLLEAMRYATITPIIPRTSIAPTKINGYDIPKNTVALISFYKINHDKKVHGDPEVFRPERFLDSNGKLIKDASSQFLQFGLGRRLCVGMPMARASFFTFFTNFFQRYTVKPSPNHPDLSLDSIVTGVNNQPAPFHCKVKLRKKFNLSRTS